MLLFQLNQSLLSLTNSTWLKQACPVAAQVEAANLLDLLQSISSWARHQHDSRGSVESLTRLDHVPHRQLLAIATALAPAERQQLQQQQQEADMDVSLQDSSRQLLILKKIMQPLVHLSACAGSLCLQVQSWSSMSSTASPGTKSTTDSKVASSRPSSAMAATVVEHLKQQLFWSCQLTVIVHRLLMSLASAQAHQEVISKWHKILPVILEQLNACFKAVVGTGTDPLSVLQTRKEAAAADQLLLFTCLSLVQPSAGSNTSHINKRKGSRTHSSSNLLPGPSRQLLASMLGCHLLFKHRQILQGQQPCDSLAHKVCRLLMDSFHSNDGMELLTTALAGLATDTTTAAHGGQILCMLADEAFRPQRDNQPHRQAAPTARAGGKTLQQPAGAMSRRSDVAAAGSSSSTVAAATVGSAEHQGCDISVALLQLLADVLAAINSNTNTQQQAAVLAAAVLPSLMPAGLLLTRPAARKLWCQVAGIAATVKLPTNAKNPASPVMPENSAPALDFPAATEVAAAAKAAVATAGHLAGMAVLAAAAQHDTDANVRCRALGLLQQACASVWQHLCFWKYYHTQQNKPERHNECPNQSSLTLEPGQTETAAAVHQVQNSRLQGSLMGDAIAAGSHTFNTCTTAVAQATASWDALTAALQSQLQGTSKASRVKALQLLQCLLQAADQSAMRQLAAAHPTGTSGSNQRSSNSVCVDMVGLQQQQQRQLVLQLHAVVAAVFEAPQEHAWHCPASKAAAEQLLPVMSQVLQHQQALHLALSTQGSYPAAAAALLSSLGRCSEHSLYGVLQQQLLLQTQDGTHVVLLKLKKLLEAMPASESSASSNGSVVNISSGRELLRQHAFMKLCQSLTAAVATAEDAATPPAEEGSVHSLEGHWQQQQQQQLARTSAQRDLMLATQVLEIAGGCTMSAISSSSSTSKACSKTSSDLRAELSILTDALDLCLHWMDKGQDWHLAAGAPGGIGLSATAVSEHGAAPAAAPAAAERHTQDMEQQVADSRMLTTSAAGHVVSTHVMSAASTSLSHCQELLCSLLRILQHTALSAVQEQYKGKWSDTSATEAHQPQASTAHPLQAPGLGVVPAQQQWAAIGSSLLHHLGLVVSLASVSSSAQGSNRLARGGGASPTGQKCTPCNHLPLTTLDLYIQVMVLGNSSQQMLLHDLLLTWHQKQQQDQHSGLLAAANSENLKASAENIAFLQHDTTNDGPAAAAFLLLLQHLAMFYSLETERFQQQLQITVKRSSATPAKDLIVSSSKLLTDADEWREWAPADQQHLQNSYMQAEEEQQLIAAATSQCIGRLLEDTAPACYVPLLLQLVQEQKAPVHIQVLALRALQPLLLVSADLSTKHQALLSVLLGSSSTPAALQLQAVATTAAIVNCRPAQHVCLVRQLEELIVQRTASSAGICAAIADADEVEAVGSSHGLGLAHDGNITKAAVASAAAGVYCQLLLQQKLLLAGPSWAVIAGGLLADGELQDVSITMQHLLYCLSRQQRLSAIALALGLLLNVDTFACRAAASRPLVTVPTTAAACAMSTACMPMPDTNGRCQPARSVQLVEQHLVKLLTKEDLASQDLMLPLLQAASEALGSSCWQAAAGPVQLLSHCTPTARCLESLWSLLQALKHSLAVQCSADVLCGLRTYAQNFSLPGADDNDSSVLVAHPGSKARVGSSRATKRSRPGAAGRHHHEDDADALHEAGGANHVNHRGLKADMGAGSLAASTQSKVLVLLTSLMKSTETENNRI